MTCRKQRHGLLDQLRRGDPAQRAAAIWQLLRLGPEHEEIAAAVLSAFSDPDPSARAAVLDALWRLGAEPSRLVAFADVGLKDPSPVVRTMALRILTGTRPADPGTLSGLAEAICADVADVQLAAIELCGDLEPLPAVLLRALQEGARTADARVRASAIGRLFEKPERLESQGGLEALVAPLRASTSPEPRCRPCVGPATRSAFGRCRPRRGGAWRTVWRGSRPNPTRGTRTSSLCGPSPPSVSAPTPLRRPSYSGCGAAARAAQPRWHCGDLLRRVRRRIGSGASASRCGTAAGRSPGP